MPRTAQPLDAARESALLRAAALAFTADGYHQASLNRIIAAAGWAKSSFYHYFPDKQRLHDHLVTVLRERLAAGLRIPGVAELDADTFWPAMTALVESLLEVLTQQPDTRLLVRMFDHPLAARGPDGRLTRLRRDVRDWCAQALEHGQRVGAVRADLSPSVLAELALAMLSALAGHGGAQPGPSAAPPPPSVAARVVEDALGRR